MAVSAFALHYFPVNATRGKKIENWSHEMMLFSKLGSCLSNFGLRFCPDRIGFWVPDCWTFCLPDYAYVHRDFTADTYKCRPLRAEKSAYCQAATS